MGGSGRRNAAGVAEHRFPMALIRTSRRARGRASDARRRKHGREPDGRLQGAPRAEEGRTPAGRGSQPPIVELRDATVVYPGGHVGLERVSLQIGRGEFAFVVGPTGCGKSTLIKLLIRELEPASGKVLIAGRDINALRPRRVPLLRRRIGTVFQDFKLLPNRTVYDNVAYALQVIGAPRSQIRRQVPEIIRLVGLQAKVKNYPDQLSGGEQQRVSIARAFVNHPPLLLADEPTGNLDPVTSIGIMQLLYRINRTGTTVLVVTHDRDMVDKMRRRVIALEEGRLIRDHAVSGYSHESTTEFAVRMRAEMGVGDEGQTNGESR
jgi:cell division transport system ATP-binding protein